MTGPVTSNLEPQRESAELARLRWALRQIIELDSSVEDTNHAMAEIARAALSPDTSASPREKLLLAEAARQRLISRGEI